MTVAVLGLFEKRFAGDDALFELARLRFQQSGLGAEMHAGSPGELEAALRFRPSSSTPVTVHLPRQFKLVDATAQTGIVALAAHAAGRVSGMIIHDDQSLVSHPEDYLCAAEQIDSRLSQVNRAPRLFIEYAAGLPLEQFSRFFQSIRPLTRLSACLDVGHVGIQESRRAFAQKRGGVDVCSLKGRGPWGPELLSDIQAAVGRALPAVLALVDTLAACGKPLHFHLHDGHPLSTFSPFGVSDHLSFLSEIPLDYEFQGRRSLPLMFGPEGLAAIVRTVHALAPGRVSFALEIHPTYARLALGDAAPLFEHWRDKTNAEQMNHWLSILLLNHGLVADALQ